MIALPLTGYIADSKLGWPLAFYLYGTVGLLWAVMWFFLGSNSPSENKLMSDEERKFIQSETAGDDHSVNITDVIKYLSLITKIFVPTESTHTMESSIHLTTSLGNCSRPLWTKLGILDITD